MPRSSTKDNHYLQFIADFVHNQKVHSDAPPSLSDGLHKDLNLYVLCHSSQIRSYVHSGIVWNAFTNITWLATFCEGTNMDVMLISVQ